MNWILFHLHDVKLYSANLEKQLSHTERVGGPLPVPAHADHFLVRRPTHKIEGVVKIQVGVCTHKHFCFANNCYWFLNGDFSLTKKYVDAIKKSEETIHWKYIQCRQKWFMQDSKTGLCENKIFMTFTIYILSFPIAKNVIGNEPCKIASIGFE